MTVLIQIILASVVAVPFNALTVWDGIAQARVEARVKAMRKAGEPTTMAELRTLYPEPPKGKNAAPFFEAAFKLMKEQGERGAGDHVPIVGTVVLPDVDRDVPKAMLDDVKAYLKAQDGVLKLLREATALDECRFDLKFEDGIAMQLEHLSQLRQGARLLALEAVSRTERGETDAAAESLVNGLRMGRALRTEPVLISALVRVACDAIAARQAERWVARSIPSAKALGKVEAALAAEADPKILTNVILAERCFGMDIYRKFALKPGGPNFNELIGGQPPAGQMLLRAVPKAYFKMDMVHYIDLMNGYVAALKKPYPESLMAGSQVGADLEKSIPRHYILCRMILPALGRTFSVAQRHMAAMDCTRLGLAALRYQARHGRLPDKLGALVPDFAKALPPDPYTGKALVYRKTADGFVLYALGENGKDDGGITGLIDHKALDVGFRYRHPKGEF